MKKIIRINLMRYLSKMDLIINLSNNYKEELGLVRIVEWPVNIYVLVVKII